MQKRLVGTVSRGLRAPIIKEGDDLKKIVVDTVLQAEKAGEFIIRNRDVLAVTESIVARSQNNYATLDEIAKSLRNKLDAEGYSGQPLGLVFPIMSRNRFAICLKAIARAVDKLVLLLGYPSDEVGNHLVDLDLLDEKGINPYTDVLNQEQFESMFGKSRHPFTGMDYINYYKELAEAEGCDVEIYFSKNPKAIVKYTDCVLACDTHTRHRTKKLAAKAGAKIVLSMDDIMTESVEGSGYNSDFGLLGSNKASEDRVKLFPINCQDFVNSIQTSIKEATDKDIEVMIYGDGAFKDPVGKIWELADPVVSPGYTAGLEGTPNEIKLKYIADNEFKDLKGEELQKAMRDYIEEKAKAASSVEDDMLKQGTTPRRLTDLIGSLCDLTSGSGDKGTPFVYIQGYFDHYTD
ncbi:coenzyme F420-0:L-glutamate ligase [Anaerovoracaceae bacterium SGI.195]